MKGSYGGFIYYVLSAGAAQIRSNSVLTIGALVSLVDTLSEPIETLPVEIVIN